MTADPAPGRDASESPSQYGLRISAGLVPGSDPWSWLPRLSHRETRLEAELSRWPPGGPFAPAIAWLAQRLGGSLEVGRPEVLWRASGTVRPALVAQFREPTLRTRLALGIEIPLAHAVVDLLLGHDRPFSESRLQLTPVEWGVWTYLVVRALEEQRRAQTERPPPEIDQGASTIASRLLLDRLGPDPFDTSDLGSIVTIRWPVRTASTAGTARLWIPESLLLATALDQSAPAAAAAAAVSSRARACSSWWRALAGTVSMPRGLGRLRTGGVLPLAATRLTGTPRDLRGSIDLVCELDASQGRYVLPVEPLADSAARLVQVRGPILKLAEPRKPLTLGVHPTMNSHFTPAGGQPDSPSPPADLSPLDIPVTLTVELGRVNLSLERLADLRPGDVIELGRHSREPVELTSNGRLVARGELVLIDTELGVRVTHVFL